LRKPDYERRVVVTGLGVVSSVGNDVQTAWGNLVEGRSGLGPITRFDPGPYEAKLAGEVQDFTPSDWMDAKAARRSESSMHFGVAAAKQALADSGFELTDENRTEVGVVFGSGAGGQSLMIDNYTALHERGNRTVAPTFIANALVDSCSGMIAIETGAIGHNICMVSACATGTHNVGEGAEAIRRGDCRPPPVACVIAVYRPQAVRCWIPSADMRCHSACDCGDCCATAGGEAISMNATTANPLIGVMAGFLRVVKFSLTPTGVARLTVPHPVYQPDSASCRSVRLPVLRRARR
jgi:hypothetical protein